jgi:hypothetical protein
MAAAGGIRSANTHSGTCDDRLSGHYHGEHAVTISAPLAAKKGRSHSLAVEGNGGGFFISKKRNSQLQAERKTLHFYNLHL